jgi:hypothetical protein
MAAMRFGLASAALGITAALTVMPVACSGNSDGFVPGPVSGVPDTCTTGTYVIVVSSQCPPTDCPSEMLFAVCEGSVFAGCSCSPPPGGVLAEGGLEDSPSESCEDTGTCTCADGFDGTMGSPDGPLFDVGDLGDCSGNVARKLSSCGSCPGAAYALCNGLTYSTCSCDLPPGYVLSDAGMLEGGANPEGASRAESGEP